MSTRMTPRKLGLLNEPLSEFGLEVRNLNALEEKGIFTAADALQCCPQREADCLQRCACRELTPNLPPDWQPKCYLADVRNFGDKALQELLGKLNAAGFKVEKPTNA